MTPEGWVRPRKRCPRVFGALSGAVDEKTCPRFLATTLPLGGSKVASVSEAGFGRGLLRMPPPPPPILFALADKPPRWAGGTRPSASSRASARREIRHGREQDPAEFLAGLRVDQDDGFGAVAADMDREAAIAERDGADGFARRDADAGNAEMTGGQGGPALAHVAGPLDDDGDDDRKAEHEDGAEPRDDEFQPADVCGRVHARGLGRGAGRPGRRIGSGCCIIGHDADCPRCFP